MNLEKTLFVKTSFERQEQMTEARGFLAQFFYRKARGCDGATAFVAHDQDALDIQMQRSVPVPPGHR